MTSTPGARRRRKGLSDQAATTAIDQACRMLRMPTIRNSFADYADRASLDAAPAGAEKVLRREIDPTAHRALLDELATQL